MEVEWDSDKAEANLQKHGVSFEEAKTVLASDSTLVLGDNNQEEPRFVAIGFSAQARLLLVVYAYRYEDKIRIISARKATRKEQGFYERRIRP